MEQERGAPARGADVAIEESLPAHPGDGAQGRRGSVASLGAALAAPFTLLSAILVLAGFWSPWMSEIATAKPGSGLSVAPSAVAYSGSDITLSGLFAFAFRRPSSLLTFNPLVASLYIWDALPICGVVLAVALWRNQAASRWLVGVYALWLLFITAVTGFGAYRAFVTLPGRPCGGSCSDPYFTYHWQIAWAIWLSFGALALAWAAFVALWLRRATSDAGGLNAAGASASAAPSPRRTPTRAAMLGAVVFTFGVALWALGLYLVPWVTAGCTGIPLSMAHFSHGSCMGLDGYDMLIAGLHKAGWTDAIAVVTAALHGVELLAVAGAVLAWLLWAPGRVFSRRAVALVAAAWALLVTLTFLIGWQGTMANLGQPAQLVFGAQGTWGIGPGVWLCALGLALGAVGSVVVWAHGKPHAAVRYASVHRDS